MVILLSNLKFKITGKLMDFSLFHEIFYIMRVLLMEIIFLNLLVL